LIWLNILEQIQEVFTASRSTGLNTWENHRYCFLSNICLELPLFSPFFQETFTGEKSIKQRQAVSYPQFSRRLPASVKMERM
jgi:hypothetical protein